MRKTMTDQKSKAPDLLNEARRVSAEGDLESASEMLSKLAEDCPYDMTIRFSYAAVLFRLRRFSEVAPQFATILEVQAVNEWASLGLFHSLWQIDRKREAAKEFRRFRVAGGESMEYRRLIKDIRRFL
jgi:hypothetical protein